jgi:hypothetical protein
MGQGIYFFAAPHDNRILCEYAESIGLRLLPPLVEQSEIRASDDPVTGPFCYLSPLPRDQLHPYGIRPLIGPATDPLIEFLRSYFRPPDLLVMGRLFCSDDVPAFCRVTNKYYTCLTKWIRENWKKMPEGQYIGHQAQHLLENGVALAYFPPNSVLVQQLDTSK